MKIVVLIVLSFILLGCKTSSGNHCDAYGKLEKVNEKTNS
jgi:hypothetical protein